MAVRRHAACETGIAADSAHITTAADVARVAVRVEDSVHVTYGKLGVVFGRVGVYSTDMSFEIGWGWSGDG